MGVAEKRLTKEGDGGYDYGSTRLSIKNYEYQEDNRQERCVCKVLRMCGEGDETVSHIVSGCRKLAQKQYRSVEARQGGAGDSLEPMWKAG